MFLSAINILITEYRVLATGTTTVWEGNYQVVYPETGGKQIIRFELESSKNTARFIGIHAKSNATISYWTTGYNISLYQIPDGKVSSFNESKRKRLNLDSQPDDDAKEDVVITTYNLNYNDLVKAMIELLKTKHNNDISKVNQDLINGVDVYFNNIFRTYNRSGGSATYIPTESDFRSGNISDLDVILKQEQWGKDTLKYLPYYYNICLNIKLLPYYYKVVFVDEYGAEIKSIEGSFPVFKGGSAEYSLPSAYRGEFTANGKKYVYGEKAGYTYTGGGASAVTVNGYKLKVEHRENKDALLKVMFREKEPDAPIPIPTPPGYEEHHTLLPAIDYMQPNTSAVIKADNRGVEKFDILQGIPTTESLYGQVLTSEYLVHARFIKTVGKATYKIPVSKTYNLSWKDVDFEGNPITRYKSEKVTQIVEIVREYSFYSLHSFDYYKIEEAFLNNYALPSGKLVLKPTGYQVPAVSYQVYGTTMSHITEPAIAKSPITLKTVLWDGSSPPYENFKDIVEGMIPEIIVKNDSFIFDGKKVLDNTLKEKAAPNIVTSYIKKPTEISNNVLYKSGNIIDAAKLNGIYESTGTIKYTKVSGHNSSSGNSQSVAIYDMNPVLIHTPVYCTGQLINDNKKYVQLIEPDNSCVPVVLDTESHSNDFIVRISNYGYHSGRQGYGTKDYSKYVLKNEVSFPFDVYIDNGNDSNDTNDSLLKANTWYKVSGDQRFHVPMWVSEGKHQARFRTTAVNGVGKESESQYSANMSHTAYVADNNEWIQVSGKVYGLTLYDINDEVIWGPVFRRKGYLDLKKNLGGTDGTIKGRVYNKDYFYYYTVGAYSQYGLSSGRDAKFTFPIIDGSHPRYPGNGYLKAGYKWNFTIQTTGNEMMQDASYIEIKPKFYHIDKKGKKREEVDLYYSGIIGGVKKNLICVGSELDLINLRDSYAGSNLLAIPEAELKATAEIRGRDLPSILSVKGYLHSYGLIKTNNAFKMYSNKAYTEAVKKRKGSLTVAESEITRRKQSYYFTYALPNTFTAVSKEFNIEPYIKKGIKYDEPFWKKDGYIIIQFEITCYNRMGIPYLSYINSDNYISRSNCNMWVMEGGQRTKTDSTGTILELKDGDTLIIYTTKTNVDDYVSGGIY